MNQKEIDLAKGRVTEEELYNKKEMKSLSSQEALNLGKGMKLRILCEDNIEIAEVEIENILSRFHEDPKYFKGEIWWHMTIKGKDDLEWEINQDTPVELL